MRLPILGAAVLLLASLPAAAQDGAGFLAKLAGSWSGSGTITASAATPPGQSTCSLTGAGSGASLTMSGSCDGAARGANIAVVLHWNEATREFAGTFQGGAESGTAVLSGRLAGNTLSMRISSASGNASTMSLTLSGADKAALRVAGKDAKTGKPVNFVSIGLKKA